MEAEWEYAARAGESSVYAGSDDVSLVAWTEANSGDHSHPVATLAANAWGLYDMSGNIIEWTWDWFAEYGSTTPLTDPLGAKTGTARVYRGGDYERWSDDACVYCRDGFAASATHEYLGAGAR